MKSFRELLRTARRPVFFTGAGMSTESGLPSFRGQGGLWQEQESIELLSLAAFESRPEVFYEFFRCSLLPWTKAMPNSGHRAIAWLEITGRHVVVVTQNIDGLHQKAGSTRVIELHGDLRTVVCVNCEHEEPFALIASPGPPSCAGCGGLLKPTVVLFGEPLPPGAFARAAEAIGQADLLCVVGTSLSVAPASYLVDAAPVNAPIVVVNSTPTPADYRAALVVREAAGVYLDREVRSL
jgi:NAD-dependent deacetylase